MSKPPSYIGVDFDGTCVTHDYPDMGEEVPHVVAVLKALLAKGHKLVLNTMRGGVELAAAVQWFNERQIELFGVNNNPSQGAWTDSPKVYANIYIDDAGLGCPLKKFNGSKVVDWEQVRSLLALQGYL